MFCLVKLRIIFDMYIQCGVYAAVQVHGYMGVCSGAGAWVCATGQAHRYVCRVRAPRESNYIQGRRAARVNPSLSTITIRSCTGQPLPGRPCRWPPERRAPWPSPGAARCTPGETLRAGACVRLYTCPWGMRCIPAHGACGVRGVITGGDGRATLTLVASRIIPLSTPVQSAPSASPSSSM